MTFAPQNFINQVTTVEALWLNGIDVTCNFVLGGAQTVPQALAALGLTGLSVPIPVSSGGTGAITAPAGLTNLGGTTLAAVETAISASYIGSKIYPTTAAEQAVLTALGASVVNSQYPQGYVDRYVTNSTPGTGTTDCAPGFNTAYRVAVAIGCAVRFGATAPYLLLSTINYTTAGGPNQNGVATIYDSAAPADIANFPLIAAFSNEPVFDCTGTTSLQFERVAVTTASGFTPNVCFLFARNSPTRGAGLQRMQHCYVIGTFTIACVYNYGAEDDFYYGCYFNNTAITASTACMQFTATNNAGVTSSNVSIATGNCSTTDHVILACQLYNSAGTTTSYCIYLDAIVFLRCQHCWMACFGSSSGGNAYIGVNQANAPSNNITIDNIMGEQNGANVPLYGILFFNTAQQNVSWIITNSIFPNTNLAISCNGTLNSCYIANITEQPSTSHGLSAVAVTDSVINAQALLLDITTSTNNVITGFSEKWTISTRTNDNWVDAGNSNKTWTPVVSGLTHTGTLTVTGAKCSLYGNLCTVELTVQSSGTLTPTAGQTISGLPFPAVANGKVDVIQVSTPASLGQGVVAASSLVLPAFSAGANAVVIQATFFIA
jgi:hypothetical protein